MASLRRSNVMPTDSATSRFLYTILKQLDHKSIDWNSVASDLEITNGHAARMRFSRFKQHMEGVPPSPRKPRSDTRQYKTAKIEKTTKTSKTGKTAKREEKRANEEQAAMKSEPGPRSESAGLQAEVADEALVKAEPFVKPEPLVKLEPMEDCLYNEVESTTPATSFVHVDNSDRAVSQCRTDIKQAVPAEFLIKGDDLGQEMKEEIDSSVRVKLEPLET